MSEDTFRLSDDLQIDDIEKLYHEVVLKQNFYGESYGTDWSPVPYEEMATILVGAMHPARHLDMGCGEGLLVKAMRAAGVDSRGIDFSEALIKRADPAVHKHVQMASTEDWLQKSSLSEVDVVSYMEVFEHLPIRTLEDILSAIHGQLNGYLFLTIPSYGIDATFHNGMVVNDGTQQWKRDMERNVPLRNIVLKNETPHLGHITLASYRWWTEFFLSKGFGRQYDVERTISTQFGNILNRYHWNPYVLGKLRDHGANLIENAQHLLGGWHAHDEIVGARWTDGYAQAVIFGDGPRLLELEVTLPSINVIREMPIRLVVEVLTVDKQRRFQWLPAMTSIPHLEPFREKRTSMHAEVSFRHHFTEGTSHTSCWRVTLISPHWCPAEYGFSTDNRRLGVLVHRLESVT